MPLIVPDKKVIVSVTEININLKVYTYDGGLVSDLNLDSSSFVYDGSLSLNSIFNYDSSYGLIFVKNSVYPVVIDVGYSLDDVFIPDCYVKNDVDFFAYLGVWWSNISSYFSGDSSSSSCDLSEVLSLLNDIIGLGQNILNSSVSSTDLENIVLHIDTSTLATKTDLQNLHIDTSTLATKTDIQNLSNDIENIILPSLNGNGSEYKDGTQVKVSGRDVVYSVERSYHSLYSDNGYTVHYDLVSNDGYRCTVPEALLTKYSSGV